MRIATFNALHGRPATGDDVDLTGLAAAVTAIDADILAVQEIDRHQPRSHHADQLALIGEALNAPYRRFLPLLHETQPEHRQCPRTTHAVHDGQEIPGPAYGLGLVSRLPILSWHTLRFAAAPLRLPLRIAGQPGLVRVPDEPRAALAAVIDAPAGPVTVICAHLSFVPGWNATQLRRISHWALALPAPRLLIGDLNLPGAVPRLLTGWQPLAWAATYPAPRPRIQFDHILAHTREGLRVPQAAALRLPVSDHCALAVELQLQRPARSEGRNAAARRPRAASPAASLPVGAGVAASSGPPSP